MHAFTEDDLRILGVAGPLLLRMLQTREKAIVDRIYGAFRNGSTDHLSAIAELACVKAQIHEINTALAQFSTKEQTHERTD